MSGTNILTKMNYIVNGTEHTVNVLCGNEVIFTYDSVVKDAGRDPSQVLTVSWGTENRQGTLTKGQRVDFSADEWPIFNVANTGKG